MMLFNTASQQLEPVEPAGGRLSLYVCGVTPYDTTHLGHAFTYVVFDVLVRLLRSLGISVSYAQNITDIDDDILRKAGEVGLPYDELARNETERYQRDMAALHVVRPDYFVPATTVMRQIVEYVQALVDKGVAYIVDGNVYFSIAAFPDYGSPCRASRADMLLLAEEHGGHPEDPKKRDPLDFLLWQGQRSGEPSWASPFGPGRPGWHIECSTIAMTYLGMPVDIHGGGSDLAFPHHASEAAQAECITEIAPFVRHWMHTAMVGMDGDKMSKSLGNLVHVRDLLNRHSADAIRLYLLSHHYRVDWEYDAAALEESGRVAARLADAWQGLAKGPITAVSGPGDESEVVALLSQDLNTPTLVTRLDAAASQIISGRPTRADENFLAQGAQLLGLTLGKETGTGQWLVDPWAGHGAPR